MLRGTGVFCFFQLGEALKRGLFILTPSFSFLDLKTNLNLRISHSSLPAILDQLSRLVFFLTNILKLLLLLALLQMAHLFRLGSDQSLLSFLFSGDRG
jgi:hypothetical protein